MARWVKALVTKPEDSNLVPETHVAYSGISMLTHYTFNVFLTYTRKHIKYTQKKLFSTSVGMGVGVS